MNNDEQQKAFRIEQVINDFREGSATPEEISEFRDLLLEDPEARRLYFEANQLTILLENADTSVRSKKKQPGAKKIWWSSGIAAALILSLIWFLNQGPSDSSPTESPQSSWLATIVSSHKARWGTPLTNPDALEEGIIILRSGIAKLEFANGASFVIEGPCTLELIDRDSIELISGKLWGHCPPAAQGFEVLTPGGNRIIDLGTEFGVGVASSGSVDVHVFDGEVELFQDGQKKRALEAGQAVQLDPRKKPLPMSADFERFTDASELQRERWNTHHQAILARDDLLLYYDFDSLQPRQKIIRNRASSDAHGRIIGTLPVNGRMPGKSALLFENPKNAIALTLDLQPSKRGFTVAMWIKPDILDKSISTLFNSNGYDSGDIHFQMYADGSIKAGIFGISSYRSEPNAVYPASWQFVTLSWDLETNRAQLYHNGKKLAVYRDNKMEVHPNPIPNFGQCQIGAWGDPTIDRPRNFVGRIDEVMVFSTPLTRSEIVELYQSSRP
ncbi:MAG: LamG domain-containing protein [Akkermansiaceae bacterium]|jgi:hypothetical protein